MWGQVFGAVSSLAAKVIGQRGKRQDDESANERARVEAMATNYSDEILATVIGIILVGTWGGWGDPARLNELLGEYSFGDLVGAVMIYIVGGKAVGALRKG